MFDLSKIWTGTVYFQDSRRSLSHRKANPRSGIKQAINMADEALPSEFDAIVLGTGMQICFSI